MEQFIIAGGRKLEGAVRIAGMKNAATPILAATVLVRGRSVIRNVPAITDVEHVLTLLQSMGAAVERRGDAVTVSTDHLRLEALAANLVNSMRSSVLFLGPLLARFREVELPQPGGCIIGNRPIDDHLSGLQQLGADVAQTNRTLRLKADRLAGTHVVLPQFSVTATENVIMAAIAAAGPTVLELAAAEPHVQDLCRFLVAAGARIEGIGTHTLTIAGGVALHGVEHTLIPDQIEVGTFAVAAAVTQGSLRLQGVAPGHLSLIRLKLRQAGVPTRLAGQDMLVERSSRLTAFRVQTLPYPGFPTDLQAPFAVLATQAHGTSLIHDPLYEGRLGYVQELIKMGANAVICDPHRVLVTGPTPLYGQEIRSLDLRAGATLVIAGLAAQGETVLHGADVLDRGYERLVERLQSVGASIRRVPA